MKLLEILFVTVAYIAFKAVLLSSVGGFVVDIPTLDIPDLDFIDLSAGCGGFTDCIEYLAAAVINIGLGLIFIILLLINLFIYAGELVLTGAKITTQSLGASPIVDTLLLGPYLIALGIIIFKMIRKGDDSA